MPYMIIHFFQNLAVSQNFFLKNSQKHASMSVLKKIMLSLVVFIMVATGTALSFVPFYNRTPFRIGVGIILAVVLYIGLLKSLVWRKKK